jgi:hypothetical protein
VSTVCTAAAATSTAAIARALLQIVLQLAHRDDGLCAIPATHSTITTSLALRRSQACIRLRDVLLQLQHCSTGLTQTQTLPTVLHCLTHATTGQLTMSS